MTQPLEPKRIKQLRDMPSNGGVLTEEMLDKAVAEIQRQPQEPYTITVKRGEEWKLQELHNLGLI